MSDVITKEYWQRDDKIHAALRASIKRVKRYLWVPADAVTFKPALAGTIYGDGRALFNVGSCDDRPKYWIVRGCSSWTLQSDRTEGDGLDFAEFSDEIHTNLEYEFGAKWLGPDDEDLEHPHPYPAIGGGGFHWGRMDWPALDGIKLVPHPHDPETTILSPRYAKRPQTRAAS